MYAYVNPYAYAYVYVYVYAYVYVYVNVGYGNRFRSELSLGFCSENEIKALHFHYRTQARIII